MLSLIVGAYLRFSVHTDNTGLIAVVVALVLVVFVVFVAIDRNRRDR